MRTPSTRLPLRGAVGAMMALVALGALRLGAGRAEAPPSEGARWAPALVRRVATLDRAPTAATIAWLQTCLEWSTGARDAARLRAGVEASQTLDPHFRAPAAYGAVMLAALNDGEGQITTLERAILAFPDDPWFPVALAMSDALRASDPEAPARWMAHAAQLPDAPAFLAAAAARMATQ